VVAEQAPAKGDLMASLCGEGAAQTAIQFFEGAAVMKNLLARFVREDQGQDLIEYAFLAVFIALAVVLAVQGIGNALTTQMSNIGTQISSGS